jgi:transposase
MMGHKLRRFDAIEALTLEDLVPADHFYRHLDRVLELAFVRELVADCDARGGRPSIDPIVFFKLQLVMFFEGIRSERQLLAVAADRLSVRWYLGDDLDEPLPDHSSLTRVRDRYGLTIFQRFFERIVEQCRYCGLVWGAELYLDATKVAANASLDSLVHRFAVAAHLAALFASDAHVAEACSARPAEAPVMLPTATTDLALPNAERHDWLAAGGQPDRSITRGGYQRRSDCEASRTDPDASRMYRPQTGLRVGYHNHYVVDGGKARIILGMLVTQPRSWRTSQPSICCGGPAFAGDCDRRR